MLVKKGKLILANFDARISDITIKPKYTRTKIIMKSKMYDESDEEKKVKIIFSDVAAIDFRINFFDNMIGAEARGLYQIEDKNFTDALVKNIFERRKEIYLLEGHYNYDEEDSADMLNVLDLSGTFEQEAEIYHAYVQNVDAGVYIIVAKNYELITLVK